MYKCILCGNFTGFIVWTSSRYFPREKLIEKLNLHDDKLGKIKIKRKGYPVCMACYQRLKEE